MPNFVALGCLKVVEKFVVVVGSGVGGLILIPTTVLHQPFVRLG